MIGNATSTASRLPLTALSSPPQAPSPQDRKLRETFDQFVGQTFFGQMISSMRQTVGKPAYFHGGRAEEIFQGQLDQAMADDLTKNCAQELTDPMFELFQMTRS
jgi:peptidoglycan hydrolase FlgJ